MKVVSTFIILFASILSFFVPAVRAQSRGLASALTNSSKQLAPESPQVLQTDIVGPVGSGQFGTTVTALPNGNIVVTDPLYDPPGPIVDAGAVYLYNGATGALINTITGSQTSNSVSNLGITVLANGNFVIRSSFWDNLGTSDVGAVTFCNGATGCSGTVNSSNSLIGSTINDNIGSVSVTPLPNGNYVVNSELWDNPLGPVPNAGASTFCSGITGCSGPISVANSLVGTQTSNSVANSGITVLANGNYLVLSRFWDNGGVSDVGAVTFCSGTSGCVGTVTSANSLIGSTINDTIGHTSGPLTPNITALPNGNYVVNSDSWDNPVGPVANVGASTLCSGTSGCTGPITTSNSLVGTALNDSVGLNGVVVLTNGNYVVNSRNWDNLGVSDVGAVTWCSGTAGCSGPVSPANSLVGTTINDIVGNNSAGGVPNITALSNGNYVVNSDSWDNPIGTVANEGAATFCSGVAGCVGTITSANSLIGSKINDTVGTGGATALTNGNYVVRSQNWDNGGTANVGAVTWCSGTTGCSGTITSGNSLIGTTIDDIIGNDGVTALPNGNYVVSSDAWNSGVANGGAVTLCDGATGCAGFVTTTNSLIGSTVNTSVGLGGSTALPNNNYVVRSLNFDGGGNTDAGAVTLCNGTTNNCAGVIVTPANSLVGFSSNDHLGSGGITVMSNGNFVVNSPFLGFFDNGGVFLCSGTLGCGGGSSGFFGNANNDFVGLTGVTALPNGNYVVVSPNVDTGLGSDRGAISYGSGNGGIRNLFNDSVFGNTNGNGGTLQFSFDTFNETLVVSQRFSNIISIFNPTYTSVANGSWSSATTWDYGAFAKRHDVVIPNSRTVNLDTIATVSSLTVNCLGAVAGASATGYVIGNIRKDYCTTGAFSYPAGTANGYSPVDANVTVLSLNPSSLTINPTQTVHPNLNAGNSLKRYWTLTENGDLMTDLTFHYLDPTDISSGESSYNLYRVASGVPIAIAPFTLNVGANTISTTNVSDFSDWAVGNLVPTVSVSGRVFTGAGAPLRNASVSITNTRTGALQTTSTDPSGTYQFIGIQPGDNYSISVSSKHYRFNVQVISVNGDLTNVDFVGSN